jgi:hypothetical protein
MFFQGEIVNYRPESSKVYLQMDVEYLDGQVGSEAQLEFATVTGILISKLVLGKFKLY